MEGNDRGPGAEDRSSPPALHRRDPARLLANQPALIEAATNPHPSFADANDTFSRKREKEGCVPSPTKWENVACVAGRMRARQSAGILFLALLAALPAH